MNIIHAIALEGTAGPEPGILLLGTPRFVPPVLGPLDVRVLPQDAGLDEGPDVHPDAVVEVRVPADCLLGEGLPADEDVVLGLAGQDPLQLLLQGLGGGKPQVGTQLPVPGVGGLAVYPVLEVRVGQAFQPDVVQLVVVYQAREPVLAPVPDVPGERAV